MPDRINTTLAQDGISNVIRDIIPKLAQLLRSSSDVQSACLCRQNAVHIHKLASEGNTFCGYRNIQMMLLTLDQAGSQQVRQQRTIGEVQDMIEHAWDQGFNDHCRVQTGGIKGTRKHIGTPEAEALFQSLGMDCTGTAFHGHDAADELMKSIEMYFGLDIIEHAADRVRTTDRMPVFLQRPKHSILVVGIARLQDGTRLLLNFDPAKPPPLNARGMLRSKLLQHLTNKSWLAAYSKNERSLRRFAAFETLSIK